MYGEDEIEGLHRLIRAGLQHWSLPDTARVSLLAVSENATFLIRVEGAPARVLRVNRPAYHSAAELASELAWSEAVRRSGTVRTPAVIPGADGCLLQHMRHGAMQRHAILYEHVDGEAPAEDERLPARFVELGRLTARLHEHARRWRRPTGFTRKAWTVRTTIGDAPHWGDWRDGPGLDRQGVAVLARAAARVGRQLAGYGTAPARFGLVHGDLRVANLLVADLVDADGALHVIDFDDCGLSWFAYDFAASISFIEHSPLVPDLHAAWCAGYRSVAGLDAADLAAIPALVMLRRMLLLAWLGSRPETSTAQALGDEFGQTTVMLAEAYLAQG